MEAVHGWPAHTTAIRKTSCRYFAQIGWICWLETAFSCSERVRILLTVVTGLMFLLLGSCSTVEVRCTSDQGALLLVILVFHSLV